MRNNITTKCLKSKQMFDERAIEIRVDFPSLTEEERNILGSLTPDWTQLSKFSSQVNTIAHVASVVKEHLGKRLETGLVRTSKNEAFFMIVTFRSEQERKSFIEHIETIS